jgi:DNA invertase Pin-like site-specific DNA recombinase
MRAVIYVRQSKDTNQTGLAVERQRADCERLCAERGWDIVRVITDNDVSATNGTRPGYAELLALAERQAVDVIVCWHVDRLTRKLTELEHVIELCERTGVRVATVSGDLDLSTDAGRLVGRILASVAKGEVERKSARQARAGRQAAESGAPPKRRAFGYKPGGYEIDPVEGPAVRDAFARLLAGGSLTGITKSLNAARLLSARGKPWTVPGVRGMLRNGRYAAIRFYRRTEEIGPGNWPAIVSEETWRAAVALLNDPGRRTTLKGAARSWLGAAFYRCGRCDSDMCTGYRKNRRRIYRCRVRQGHLARAADPIDEFVSAVIVARLRRPDLADLLTVEAPETVTLHDEARGLRARLDTVAADYADGLLTARQLGKATERIEARLAELNAKIAAAGRVGALSSVASARDPGSAWLTLDVAGKQAVARELCTVTLLPASAGRRPFDPATVRIQWRQP